jgi:hypothetical protein
MLKVDTMNDVEAKILCAEQLLVRVAAALRRVPFEEKTKSLHLRALQLKTTLRELRDGPKDLARSEAVLEELGSLLTQVSQREWS